MKRFGLVAVLAAVVMSSAPPTSGAAAAAADDISAAGARSAGTFGGIDYVQYDGVFEGETSTGAFRVPYRITAPATPSEGNGTVLVEPSHFAIGLGALNKYLGREFLLSRGFVHAGIGWSDLFNRILDPTVPGTFVDGGSRRYGGHTDDEIVADFARALVTDADAAAMAGTVHRRYVTGFSDSSDPVLRLVTSGGASGIFDLAVPFTVEKHKPQEAIAAGRYDGRLIVVNSEAEKARGLIDTGAANSQYRFYAVAGTPHVPDHFDSTAAAPTSPASYSPELRARFLQGDDWVLTGAAPPPSTHLRTSQGTSIDRDATGNAIVVDTAGALVARLPFVELGEARFVSGFRGGYDTVKSIEDLGFASHADYLAAFGSMLAGQSASGHILAEDAEVMRARAGLCPPLTFTQTYSDHYSNFVAVQACDQTS